MRDLRLIFAWLAVDRDRIDLPVVDVVLLGVVFRRIDKMLLLTGSDGELGMPIAARCSSFDLDDDHASILHYDQVEFTVGGAGIPLHDLAAFFLQIIRCDILAPAADGLVVFSHGIKYDPISCARRVHAHRGVGGFRR